MFTPCGLEYLNRKTLTDKPRNKQIIYYAQYIKSSRLMECVSNLVNYLTRKMTDKQTDKQAFQNRLTTTLFNLGASRDIFYLKNVNKKCIIKK